MDTDGQADAVAFLSDPATHGGTGVETMLTHISRVFLTGERAYKMKRAVKLPYADFSTPGRRLAACAREVELNSMTAPDLYLGVRRITRGAAGAPEFDGDGPLVDAVVAMRRFDQSALFDRMAREGRLTPGLMTETARTIRRFHREAPIADAGDGAANMRRILEINRAGFAAGNFFDEAEVGALDAGFHAALARHATLLDSRAAAGKVRRCHGDLHLRNICLVRGEPCLFDCIEFSEQIATTDILYDLSFLLMDLWHRGFPELANLVANRYLDEADDEDGFVLLPFFMAVRAAIRAHVLGTQAAEGGGDAKVPGEEARSYFTLATALLEERPVRLVAIGGLSGSGKTTIADALAAHVGTPPGARIVESDRIRKAMHGVPPETRLPEKAYRPEISGQVYGDMVWRAGVVLSTGGCVVANAVFDRPADRARIESAAATLGLPFLGIWLEAAPDILWQRVERRKTGTSDATVDILSQQLQRDAGTVGWQRIDASRSPPEIVGAILALPSG